MSIVGISGKMQSGKDTVGRIWQYLVFNQRLKEEGSEGLTFQQFMDTVVFTFGGEIARWQIKKFAGKLKQICSLLTGIPIEELEKEEVKNRTLGPEWNRFMWNRFIQYKERKIISAEKPYPHITEHSMTVRQLFQEVGTDAIRNCVHPNAWVNALFADYKPVGYYYKRTSHSDGLVDKLIEATQGKGFDKRNLIDAVEAHEKETAVYPNWLITDVRFPNEAQAVKDRGGVLIRVKRPDFIENALTGQKFPIKLHKKEHESETALDEFEYHGGFDYIIHNDGTLEELIKKVAPIYNEVLKK